MTQKQLRHNKASLSTPAPPRVQSAMTIQPTVEASLSGRCERTLTFQHQNEPMKTLPRILMILSALSSAAFGDGGIPVNRDTNQVTVPHEMLTVSDSQTEEIETMGTLTLSSEQWEQLRAISSGCPKRIEEILPSTYRDCGCALIGVFYGIQLSPNQVAVPHYEIAEGSDSTNVRSALNSSTKLILRMDGRGQFYHGGALIPYGELLQLLANSGKSDRKLGVVRPIGVKRNSAIAKERLDALFKTAAAAGWEEWNLALDEN
jgi:hypothetical protein